MPKTRGAYALTRAGRSLYTINLKSACREPDLSLAGLDPVPQSKIGIHFLASLSVIGTLLPASELPVPVSRLSTGEDQLRKSETKAQAAELAGAQAAKISVWSAPPPLLIPVME